MRPFFSVIIPTYNVGDRIKKTVESIVCQEFESYEIIIIDAQSESASRILLKELNTKYESIRIIFEKDNGIYDAMNKGIRIAEGSYFIFLGAGDYLVDSTVFKKVHKCINDNLVDIMYGYVLADSGIQKRRFERHMNFWYTIRFQGICHQAVFARAELFKEKMFDENYKICADQDWLLYMYKMNKRIIFIDEAITNWLLDGISNSKDGFKQGVCEKFIIQRKYYPVRTFVHYILWIGKTVIKSLKQ